MAIRIRVVWRSGDTSDHERTRSRLILDDDQKRTTGRGREHPDTIGVSPRNDPVVVVAVIQRTPPDVDHVVRIVLSHPRMTRTVAYLRVSTDKQADHGVSLDAQRAKVEQYASLYDLELVEILVDAGESAKSLNRPALQQALGMLRSGKADAILVVKLDRLTRSVRDLCDLVDSYFRDGKWSLLSVGEQIDTRSASGRMMLSMLTVIGQWEREAIGERTATAMAHMASEGRYTGGRAPFGFALADDGETLVEVADEHAVICDARALRSSGMTLRAVAATLALRGRRSRTGKTFAPSAIAAMLGPH